MTSDLRLKVVHTCADIRNDARWALCSDNRFMVRAHYIFWSAVMDGSLSEPERWLSLYFFNPTEDSMVPGRGRVFKIPEYCARSYIEPTWRLHQRKSTLPLHPPSSLLSVHHKYICQAQVRITWTVGKCLVQDLCSFCAPRESCSYFVPAVGTVSGPVSHRHKLRQVLALFVIDLSCCAAVCLAAAFVYRTDVLSLFMSWSAALRNEERKKLPYSRSCDVEKKYLNSWQSNVLYPLKSRCNLSCCFHLALQICVCRIGHSTSTSAVSFTCKSGSTLPRSRRCDQASSKNNRSVSVSHASKP